MSRAITENVSELLSMLDRVLKSCMGTPGLACTVERIYDYVMFFYELGTKHKNI